MFKTILLNQGCYIEKARAFSLASFFSDPSGLRMIFPYQTYNLLVRKLNSGYIANRYLYTASRAVTKQAYQDPKHAGCNV